MHKLTAEYPAKKGHNPQTCPALYSALEQRSPRVTSHVSHEGLAKTKIGKCLCIKTWVIGSGRTDRPDITCLGKSESLSSAEASRGKAVSGTGLHAMHARRATWMKRSSTMEQCDGLSRKAGKQLNPQGFHSEAWTVQSRVKAASGLMPDLATVGDGASFHRAAMAPVGSVAAFVEVMLDAIASILNCPQETSGQSRNQSEYPENQFGIHRGSADAGEERSSSLTKRSDSCLKGSNRNAFGKEIQDREKVAGVLRGKVDCGKNTNCESLPICSAAARRQPGAMAVGHLGLKGEVMARYLNAREAFTNSCRHHWRWMCAINVGAAKDYRPSRHAV